jgi:hypothetical protein
VADRKYPEAPQFDPSTLRQCLDNLIDNRVNNPHHVAGIEMRVARRDNVHEFRFDHYNLFFRFLPQDADLADRKPLFKEICDQLSPVQRSLFRH